MNKKHFDMYSFEEEQVGNVKKSGGTTNQRRKTRTRTHSASNREYAIDDAYAIDSFEAIDSNIKYNVTDLSTKLKEDDAIGVRKCAKEIHESFNKMIEWQDKYKIVSPYVYDKNDPEIIENNKKIEQGIKDYEQLVRDIENNCLSSYSPDMPMHYDYSPEPKYTNVTESNLAKSNLDSVVENIKDIGFAFLYGLLKPFLKQE